MAITKTYSTLIARCKDFSAFEGRELLSASGESKFAEVLITSQDESLVTSYLETAFRLIEDVLGNKLSASSYTTTGCSFNLDVDSARFRSGALEKDMDDAALAYVMAQWLKERKPERYDAYNETWNTMCAAIKKAAYTKTRPA